MITQVNAAKFHKSISAEQDRLLRLQAFQDPHRFLDLAEQQGYHLSLNNLAESVAALSEEAIAAIWNPGIGPRRHLIRR